MEQEGFEPSVEDTELTLRNCPFDALAKEQPALVCGVNLDYVSRGPRRARVRRAAGSSRAHAGPLLRPGGP